MFNKSCRWLDSNPCPLLSEPTALWTVPQPLPYLWLPIRSIYQNAFFFWACQIFFKKMGYSMPLFLYFRLLNTVESNSIKTLPMTGFEPRTSGVGTTALPTEPPPLSRRKNVCSIDLRLQKLILPKFSQHDSVEFAFNFPLHLRPLSQVVLSHLLNSVLMLSCWCFFVVVDDDVAV